MNPLKFDAGVQIGTQGMGKDDVNSITLTITNASDLTLTLLGLRVQSGQLYDPTKPFTRKDTQGSFKMTGTVPSVPIPPTAYLIGSGLIPFIRLRKKRLS